MWCPGSNLELPYAKDMLQLCKSPSWPRDSLLFLREGLPHPSLAPDRALRCLARQRTVLASVHLLYHLFGLALNFPVCKMRVVVVGCMESVKERSYEPVTGALLGLQQMPSR